MSDHPSSATSGRHEPVSDGHASLAEEVVTTLTARGESLAVAESLTGGSLCGALVAVPGCSAVLRGGLVAYAVDLKARLLGVDAELLASTEAVAATVAAQMATGARRLLAADWAVATTGVAGPAGAGGRPPGTVFVAVEGPRASSAVEYRLSGARAEVRAETVVRALTQLSTAL